MHNAMIPEGTSVCRAGKGSAQIRWHDHIYVVWEAIGQRSKVVQGRIVSAALLVLWALVLGS